MKWVSIIVAALAINTANAVEVSWEQWQEIESRPLNSANWQSFDIKAASKVGLSAHQIWTVAQLINQLQRQPALTSEQRAWLEKTTLAGGVVTTRSADHPETPITLIDLRQQAQSALDYHQHKSRAEQLLLKNQHGDLTVLLMEAPLVQRFLINALSADQKEELKQQILSSRILPENRPSLRYISYHLVRAQPDIDLAKNLLQHPQNQYSVQLLNRLPQMFPAADALDIIATALDVTYLQSLGYQLLAKYYPLEPLSKTWLLQGLAHPDTFWVAYMAARKLPWSEQQSGLQTLLPQLPQDKARLVAALVNEEAAQ